MSIETLPTSRLSTLLSKALSRCQQHGGKLTEKRERVLTLMLQSNKPLSAYEVADQLNKKKEQSIPAMSVYRMLDFLVSIQLVHKLSSANKYIACSHIACEHSHEVPQFLICRTCQKVKEIGIPKTVVDQLRESVTAADFRLLNTQLELDCICKDCA
jgi:Fur family zinc uptake transcriptional regulator